MTDTQQQYRLANPVFTLWASLTEATLREGNAYNPWSVVATDRAWQLMELIPILQGDSPTPGTGGSAMCWSLLLLLRFWVPNLHRPSHAEIQLWLANSPERLLAIQQLLVSPAVSEWLWGGVRAISTEAERRLDAEAAKKSKKKAEKKKANANSSSSSRKAGADKEGDDSKASSGSLSKKPANSKSSSSSSSSSSKKASRISSSSKVSNSDTMKNSNATSSSRPQGANIEAGSGKTTSTTTSSSSSTASPSVMNWDLVVKEIGDVESGDAESIRSLFIAASGVTKCSLLFFRHLWYLYKSGTLGRRMFQGDVEDSGEQEEGEEGEDCSSSSSSEEGSSDESSSSSSSDDDDDGSSSSSSSRKKRKKGRGKGDPCYDRGPRCQRGDFSGWLPYMLPPYPYLDFATNKDKPLPQGVNGATGAVVGPAAAAAAAGDKQEAAGAGVAAGAEAWAAAARGKREAAEGKQEAAGVGGKLEAAVAGAAAGVAAGATAGAAAGATAGAAAVGPAAAPAAGGKREAVAAGAAAGAATEGGRADGSRTAAAGRAEDAARAEESDSITITSAAGAGAVDDTKPLPTACVRTFCKAAKAMLKEKGPSLKLPHITTREMAALVKHMQVLHRGPTKGGENGDTLSELLLLLATLLRLSSMEMRGAFWMEHGRDLLVLLITLVEEHQQDLGMGSGVLTTSSSSSSSSGGGSGKAAGGKNSTKQQHQQQQAAAADVSQQRDQAANTTTTTTSSSSSTASGEKKKDLPRGLVMCSWGLVQRDLQQGQEDLVPVYMDDSQQSTLGLASEVPDPAEGKGWEKVKSEVPSFPGVIAMMLSCLLLEPCPSAQTAMQEGAQGRLGGWPPKSYKQLRRERRRRKRQRKGGKGIGEEEGEGEVGRGAAGKGRGEQGVGKKRLREEEEEGMVEEEEEEEEQWEELPEGKTATFGSYGKGGTEWKQLWLCV